METIDRTTLDGDGVGVGKRPHKLGKFCVARYFGGGFAGQHHEFPTVTARAHRHGGDGPRRIAMLQADSGETVHIILERRVDDEPRLIKAHVFERQVRRAAHLRTAAIATDEKAGGNFTCAAIVALHLHGDAGAVVNKPCDLRTETNVGKRFSRKRRPERKLQRRLVEHRTLREAGRLDQRIGPEAHEKVARRIAELVGRKRRARRQHSICTAGHVQKTHHLMVEMGRTRQRIDITVALADRDAEPCPREIDAKRCTDGAKARDQHICLFHFPRHDACFQPMTVAPFSSTTLFSIWPSFSISMRTTSPTLRTAGGFIAMPTPDGVPEKIISPASSVKACERCAT